MTCFLIISSVNTAAMPVCPSSRTGCASLDVKNIELTWSILWSPCPKVIRLWNRAGFETTESRGGVWSTSIVSSLEDVSGSWVVFDVVPFDASLPLVMTTSSLSLVSLKSAVAGVESLLSGDDGLKKSEPYNKRLVYRINPSLLLKINLQNTWTLQLYN